MKKVFITISVLSLMGFAEFSFSESLAATPNNSKSSKNKIVRDAAFDRELEQLLADLDRARTALLVIKKRADAMRDSYEEDPDGTQWHFPLSHMEADLIGVKVSILVLKARSESWLTNNQSFKSAQTWSNTLIRLGLSNDASKVSTQQ